MSEKLYKSVIWLKKRFIIEGSSMAEMAIEANVTEMTIRRSLEGAGLIVKL